MGYGGNNQNNVPIDGLPKFLPIPFVFQAIQFIQTVLIQTIQFSVSTVLMSKTVLYQTNQFSISMQFKYQNSSI